MAEIFISLKPKFAKLIRRKQKDHEYRRYNPNQPVTKLWTYVSGDEKKLKYIIETSEPIEYPETVPPGGVGNEEFNAGEKDSTFAFPINHLYRIDHNLPYSRLKDEFEFYPPQRYTYTDKYPELVEYIQGSTTQVF